MTAGPAEHPRERPSSRAGLQAENTSVGGWCTRAVQHAIFLSLDASGRILRVHCIKHPAQSVPACGRVCTKQLCCLDSQLCMLHMLLFSKQCQVIASKRNKQLQALTDMAADSYNRAAAAALL